MILEIGESDSDSDSESEEGTQLVGFSGKRRTLQKDIQAFASILSEFAFGNLRPDQASIPTGIPDFVSTIIRTGLFPIFGRNHSFNTILEIEA
jgi:hypothetical protein